MKLFTRLLLTLCLCACVPLCLYMPSAYAGASKAAYYNAAAFKTFTQLIDAVDYPLAAHVNSAYDEIEAIEQVLGIDPAGSLTTVDARLDVSLNADGSLKSTLTPAFAALSVTGNATFDTNTLFVDAANNRVGVGKATPAYQLDVVGSMAITGNILMASGTGVRINTDDGILLLSGSNVGGDVSHGSCITLVGNDYDDYGAVLAGCMLIKAGNAAAGGKIVFDTAGLNRIQIDYLGQLGIGVDPAGNAQSLLEVRGGATTVGSVVTFATKEITVDANDVLGRINFNAPLEASGTDALLAGASIAAVAEDTFTSSVNKTSLVFQTGASETATTKMTIDSFGKISIGGELALVSTKQISWYTGAVLNAYIMADSSNISLVNSTRIFLSSERVNFNGSTVPQHYNSAGTINDMAIDGSYIYVCTDTNVWKRVQLNLTSW